MRKHVQYLRYVCKHKYHVFRACIALKVPLHQALIHDWVKFLPVEWIPYVQFFYGIKNDATKRAFDIAWNHHQKTQPHHWQYWLLITDTDEPRLRALDIPQRFVLEMVADWYGAGMAIHGKADVAEWYQQNKEKILLSDNTRTRVEQAIATMPL